MQCFLSVALAAAAARLPRLLIVSYLPPDTTCYSITDTVHMLMQHYAALASRSTPPVALHLLKCRSHTAATGVFVCLAVTSHYTPITQHLQHGVTNEANP